MFSHWNYWLAHFILSKRVSTANLTVLGAENLLLCNPTFFYSNHFCPDDLATIGLGILAETKKRDISDSVIRMVMADDIYLGDGTPYDGLKNHVLNALAEFSGQLVMKRKDSTHPKPRQPTTLSVASTLDEGSHVLLAPMGTMTLDGRIDYVKLGRNWVFDNRAYQKIRRITHTEFSVQPVHINYDPVSDQRLVSVGKATNYDAPFDYLDGMRSCTTITPIQFFSCYKSVMNTLGRTNQSDDIVVMKDVFRSLSEQGFSFYPHEEQELVTAQTYWHNRLSGRQEPKTLHISNGTIDIDSCRYQRNQVVHTGLERVIHKHVRRTLL